MGRAHWLLFLPAGLLLFFLLAPLLRLGFAQNTSLVLDMAGNRGLVGSIRLSLETAATAALIAVLLGVPLGYLMARSTHTSLLHALVDLPLAVPHSVAGIALLTLFGRNEPLGPMLHGLGLGIYGTYLGIVAGMLFVSAPYAVNAAREAFLSVGKELDEAARCLGATPLRVFLKVSLPLARSGILAGFAMSYARAISEIGTIMILAYYPMTAPIKIYEFFLESGLRRASAASVVLLIITLGSFLLLRFALREKRS